MNTYETAKYGEFVKTAKVREFSNDIIHSPGQKASLEGYSIHDLKSDTVFSLSVYANGNNDDSKGWISLLFENNSRSVFNENDYLECTVVVGVIDTSGDKRFLRSFTYAHNWFMGGRSVFNANFGLEQYMERKTLLSEPFLYLPEDCLTLHVEVNLKSIPGVRSSSVLEYLKQVEVGYSLDLESEFSDADSFVLRLDSYLGERLKEESALFRVMSETQLMEGITRTVKLPKDEKRMFELICRILMGAQCIEVDSFADICQMYSLADKYNIPVLIEECRSLVISFLRFRSNPLAVESVARSIPRLSELAEMCDDVDLKEMIETYLKSQETGVESGILIQEDGKKILENGWSTELVELGPLRYFSLSKIARENERYDFYG